MFPCQTMEKRKVRRISSPKTSLISTGTPRGSYFCLRDAARAGSKLVNSINVRGWKARRDTRPINANSQLTSEFIWTVAADANSLFNDLPRSCSCTSPRSKSTDSTTFHEIPSEIDDRRADIKIFNCDRRASQCEYRSRESFPPEMTNFGAREHEPLKHEPEIWWEKFRFSECVVGNISFQRPHTHTHTHTCIDSRAS